MNLFSKLKSLNLEAPLSNKKGHFVVDDQIGISLSIASTYLKNHKKYLVITSNYYKAQKIYNILTSFLDGDSVALFPDDELLRAEALSASKEIVSQRVFVLNKILKNEADIIIANLSAAGRFLPSIDLFKQFSIQLNKDEEYDIPQLRKILTKNGYTYVSKVNQSLQYAVRGDILDIYSVNYDKPIRIEFFGDTIESIRFFDVATQTSFQELESIEILPGSDILLNDEEIKNAPDKILNILEKDKTIRNYGDFEILRDNVVDDITRILENNIDQKIYKYYSLISSNHYSLFDYCKNYKVILVDDDGIDISNKLIIEDSWNFLQELNSQNKTISHLEIYQDIHRLIDFNSLNVIKTSLLAKNYDDIILPIKQVPFQANKKEDALAIIHTYLNQNYQIILALAKQQEINLIEQDLLSLKIPFELVRENNLPSKTKIGISLSSLPQGFSLDDEKIVLLTSFELFKEQVHSSRFDSRFKSATILKSYEDIEPGDYVVHEYQGIGQFISVTTLEVDGLHNDYLKIAYAGGEILYVPLNQFQLVRKYVGKEGARPRLSHLHSKDWENTKRKIKERINDLAKRLMELYIERSKAVGFAFQKDDEFTYQFEHSFKYSLTPDQENAWKEIKEDMEKPIPMDRLLCGDVGFGKTEVAFRAAFKAINSGKQVAILCPTTLLARQHYEVAVERFADFGIKIAVFSRLIPEKKQKEYIDEIKSGKTHLVIGTHRLLSKDIVFNDLGLLIVDEEQRFGVEQKERIKELKNNIDVLTLSATPIPRTLQISLLGVRSLSKIETAPENRMPIQTYVSPFKLDVVKELIERELGRGGQVFYLHNNISTLYSRVNTLRKMLGDVNIGVAHGKMNREDIEDVMSKFYNNEIQVLVCTSIIENGIDVPNANMIIVEDSEHYGLAQLYQIKGRVGRGDRLAYAYLMYSENAMRNEKTRKRLKAIQDFTELGSGFKIAQRDLMIRGAGDILGPEQAGFIDSIGLDMYIKLLNETVKEKTTGVVEERKEIEFNPSLSIDAYIPSDYANEADKIGLYQEIVSSPSLESLAIIKNKTRDIYGKLPDQVELLFTKRTIDLLVKEAKVTFFEEYEKTLRIVLSSDYTKIKGIGNIMFEAIIPYLKIINVSYAKNEFKILMTKKENWVEDLINILQCLANILKMHNVKEIV